VTTALEPVAGIANRVFAEFGYEDTSQYSSAYGRKYRLDVGLNDESYENLQAAADSDTELLKVRGEVRTLRRKIGEAKAQSGGTTPRRDPACPPAAVPAETFAAPLELDVAHYPATRIGRRSGAELAFGSAQVMSLDGQLRRCTGDPPAPSDPYKVPSRETQPYLDQRPRLDPAHKASGGHTRRQRPALRSQRTGGSPPTTDTAPRLFDVVTRRRGAYFRCALCNSVRALI
jgi:hypothetical protein